MRFAGSGAKEFTQELNTAIRDPNALRRWYLSVINGLAERMHIEALSITGLWWAEVDYPSDLHEIRAALADLEGDALRAASPRSGHRPGDGDIGSTRCRSPSSAEASTLSRLGASGR